MGTFVLILLGCGSVAVALVGLPGSGRQTGAFGPANWLIICLGWGLGVTFGVYVAGGISGAHLNPAITFAWAWRRDFPYRKIPAYVLAQLLGAFAAAAVVYALYHPAFTAFDRANKFGWTRFRSSPPSRPGITTAPLPDRCSTRWSAPQCWWG
jgi:glycerol uptake facilitator protein